MMVFRRPGKKGKTFALVLAGGAMAAMGVSSVLLGGHGQAPAVVSSSHMTMGNTATVQYSETMVTSMAVPQDKAPPYGG